MDKLAGLVAAVILTAVATAAGMALTGGIAFVSTRGVSMEPRISHGDLVVVAPVASYEVGDVAAYRSEQLDTVVLHRIVDTEADGFTFKGDHNSWLDPERPTGDELIGKKVLHIPSGGVWLDRLTSPAALGLVTFGLLATGGAAVRAPRRRRGKTMSQHAARSHKPRRSMVGLPPWASTTAVVAAVTGLVGVGLGVLAWTTPSSAPSPMGAEARPRPTMAFSYSAEVPESPAYDDATVTPPEPIFRKIVDEVEVAYTYRGRPGTVSVAAELSTPSGWHSRVPLSAERRFSGNSYSGTVTLDLAALERHAHAAAEATGIAANQVDVTVVPTVTTSGGKTFAPELAFSLSPLQLTMVGEADSLTVGTADAGRPAAGATAGLTIAGRTVSVPTARMISLLLVAGALLAAGFVAAFARLSAPATESAAIHRRYGQMLVRVQPMPAPAGRPIIDVADFATLATIAERYELLVLHWSRSDVETFVVQDQGTTFRYRTGVGVVRESAERVPAVL
jgi:signal peptidase I